MRKTSAPESNSDLISRGEDDAGPSVARIFVLRSLRMQEVPVQSESVCVHSGDSPVSIWKNPLRSKPRSVQRARPTMENFLVAVQNALLPSQVPAAPSVA